MSSSPTESAAVGDAAVTADGSNTAAGGPGAAAGRPDPATGSTLDVLMPQMGTSMVEGTVVAWRVAVGDAVSRDDVLCEVTTDKVDVECPAPADGVVVELVAGEGETFDVGAVIARLAAGSADAADRPLSPDDPGASPGASSSAPLAPVAGPTTRREALRRSSPVAARLAAEHGIDVLGLQGSGRNGRVTKRDVLDAAAGPAAPAPALMHTESPYRHDPSIPVAGGSANGATAAVSGPAAGATASASGPADPATATASGPATATEPGRPGRADLGPADPAPTDPAPAPVVPSDLGGVAEPASRMRRSIGAAVRRSLDTAAHCTTVVECDMSRVERDRRELGLTALPLLAHHTIRALREFPALNATFDGETVTRYGERVHLGFAVSLGEDGLIAPVVHDAQDLSVEGLARRIKDLAARARAGRLSPDEVRGGTFTITNPGAAGALMATPVINLPQVAILDLEAIVRRPVVVTDAEGGESIGIRPMVHLCMGWDHRALDGLYAAQFLTALRRRVEG